MTTAADPLPHKASAIAGLNAPAAYGLFVLAATLGLFSTVATMVGTWANSSAYHHGFVIAPLVVWLIRRSHKTMA